MRKFTFVLTLIALLVISTAIVYAGVEWDADPYIDEGIWLQMTVTTEDAPDGWSPSIQYDARVESDDGEIEAEAEVWVTNYDEDEEFSCTLVVRLTDGEGGDVLAAASGSCEEAEIEWESD